MKMHKWLKKTDDDHEAGSSSSRIGSLRLAVTLCVPGSRGSGGAPAT
jgi:hypothetical protein